MSKLKVPVEYRQKFAKPTKRMAKMEKKYRVKLARPKVRLGRPMIGEGSIYMPMSIEKGLLRRLDNLCREQGLCRSQVVAQSLKKQLGRKE